jgi:hypothetical protein
MLQNFTNVIKGQIILFNYVKPLSNKGVDVWNSLETKCNEINSYNIFKKQIKQHFLLYTSDNFNTIRHAINIYHSL